MRRICHITSAHPRLDIRIFRKECVSLGKSFDVDLVLADGGGSDRIDGVQIIDIGGEVSARMRRLLIQPWRLFSFVRAERYDLVHLHDSEMLPVGLVLSWLGTKVIYDSHEDLPRQVLSKPWIPKMVRPFIAWAIEVFENFVVRRLAGVICATPQIFGRFRDIHSNVANINNFPLVDELAPCSSKAERESQVCYVGGIGRIRGVREIVDALPLVPMVRLVLCGAITDARYRTELESSPGWAQVDYLGEVDRPTVQRVMASSVAGLVTFLPYPNHVNAQPNKMFEYMSAELPVIASDFPLWRDIIVGEDAGICVNPSSSEQIASAIRQLLEDPELVDRLGKAGRQAVLRKYNWPEEERKLMAFYKEVS